MLLDVPVELGHFPAAARHERDLLGDGVSAVFGEDGLAEQLLGQSASCCTLIC